MEERPAAFPPLFPAGRRTASGRRRAPPVFLSLTTHKQAAVRLSVCCLSPFLPDAIHFLYGVI